MAQIRIKGPQTGSDLGTVTAELTDGTRDSASTTSFLKPVAVSGLPRISDGFDTDTFSLDTTGLTGIAAYDWRIVGGTRQGTASTLSGSGLGRQWLECEVTCDQGTLVSPPVMVYSSAHMGMQMSPGHIADDAAIVAVFPHKAASHIAVADGSWTDPATWHNGMVPMNGANVLIPHGINVTYDEGDIYRLDRVRVDGTLTWALDQSTNMLVETLLGTRGSSIIIGTAANRVPAAFTHTITISGKAYNLDSYFFTDIDLARDTKLWGRGFISQGLVRVWGREKTTWLHADAGVPAGATSLTLKSAPVGWDVGDEIIIGGTKMDYAHDAVNPQSGVFEDEYRTITSIDGATISWTTPLVNNHGNQLAGSTRTDLYPVVMMRNGKNVILQSEVTAPHWRRGHCANVHHHAEVDIWDMAVIGLGRTAKDRAAGVFVNDDADVRYKDGTITVTESKTAQSNVQSRYSLHAHHLGFNHTGPVPIYSNNYVEDVPGHGMVHHACDARMDNNAIHRFFGAAMVSESANEVNSWVGNCAMTTTWHSRIVPGTTAQENLFAEPKNLEGIPGRNGDNFRHGYGFGFRGRAMRTNRNVAVSCNYGHVYWHRDDVTSLNPVANLVRSNVDISTAGQPNSSGAFEQFKYVDYPILHAADNEAIACFGGMFVSKENPKQNHDVNVKLKRLKAWGYKRYAINAEYIATYVLDGFDAVSGFAGVGNGITLGSNVQASGTVRARSEGNAIGLNHGGLDTFGVHDNYTQDNPRWFGYDYDLVDNITDIALGDPTPGVGQSGTDVFLDKPDWDGTELDYSADPSETFPLTLGTWNGSSLSNEFNTNADGKKIDNMNAMGEIAPKIYGDALFGVSSFNLGKWRENYGYWQYGGNNVLVVPYFISDRVTGRPAKVTKMYTVTGGSGGSNNGSFTYTTTAVTGSDLLETVAENGSVVVDVLTDASPGGAGGAGTYSLDTLDYLAPDHGTAELDGGTGEVTYTPDRNYTGTDEMFVFIESHGQYKTIKISFLIGAGGSVSAPVVGTNFSAADGGSQSIDIALNTSPSTGGRRIDLVQYSTDAGSSWRRLCNRWVQAVHNITVASDGTAIAAGSYSLSIRYRTDYDFTTSAASAADPVTVT